MSRKDNLKAELELLEAEEVFRQKKAAGTLTIEDRHALRVLRQAYRENHRQAPKDGVQVGTIGAGAEVEL